MTVQAPKTAAQPSDTQHGTPNLTRLRIREAALRQQAAQLQARAEHLERVGRAQAKQLQRRVDAHEKIVLGALVKKAGLALPLFSTSATDNERNQSDDGSLPIGRGVAAEATVYDQALILGSLMWLAAVLNQPANSGITSPDLEHLRVDGKRVLSTRRKEP